MQTPRENVERALIHHIFKSSENLSKLKAEGIEKASFIVYPEVFDFIGEYFRQYKEIPSIDIVYASFSEFNTEAIDGDFDYFIDSLREYILYSKVYDVMEFGALLLDQGKVGEAIYFVQNGLIKVTRKGRISNCFTDSEALERLEKFREKRKLIEKGVRIGIKTGLPMFDNKLVGWTPGQLIGIVGRLGTGKTWMLLYTACSGYSDGFRILFLSPEMIIDEINSRWDTIMAKMIMGFDISNIALSYGVKNINEKNYEKFLAEVSKEKRWKTCDLQNGRVFTVSGIEGEIEDFKPDLVALDGVDRLGGIEGGQSWEQMRNLSLKLKDLAKVYNCVIIASAQSGRGSEQREGKVPEAYDVYGGDAFAQQCDILLTLGRDRKGAKTRFIKLPKRRIGKDYEKLIKISFDVDVGDIGRIMAN